MPDQFMILPEEHPKRLVVATERDVAVVREVAAAQPYRTAPVPDAHDLNYFDHARNDGDLRACFCLCRRCAHAASSHTMSGVRPSW